MAEDNIAPDPTQPASGQSPLEPDSFGANFPTIQDSTPEDGPDINFGFLGGGEDAQRQANIRANDNNPEDWRVRLRLAPGSTALYKNGDSGILNPLKATDGVIFPYTPQIIVNYQADYNKTQPTHSNYAQYFYTGSQITDIQLTGTFTAQSTKEADYLLAVIHFLRSATKMNYGQDPNAGTPPPMVFLDGHGENQFNDHPCVIQQFNYVLPPDVDYVRTSGSDNQTVNLQNDRTQVNGYRSAIGRLFDLFTGQGINKGGMPNIYGSGSKNLANPDSSYVPTKIELTMTLHPIVSRKKASQQFSVADYAQGSGLRRGFW